MATKRSAVLELPAELGTDVRLCSRGASVTVRGEVDVHTAARLQERLDEVVGQGEDRVVVHLDDVTFLDATGLGVLVGAHSTQRAGGGSLELVCSNARLLRILGVTGLDRILTVHTGEAPGPAR
jgi:anti-sigma B factor antagonist